jgi:hypothetical protein
MNDEVNDRKENGWHLRKYGGGHIAGVAFDCPGCGSDNYVPVDAGERGWQWDGNEQAPTLTPSLGQRCCTWHGYLRAGKFEPC